jgi:Ring finger domain
VRIKEKSPECHASTVFCLFPQKRLRHDPTSSPESRWNTPPHLLHPHLAAMTPEATNTIDAPAASQNLAPEAILQQQILTSDIQTCVICLETITERAVALPCKHDCFDFPCLGNWLTKHTTCPLCKGEVEKLEYEFNGAGESKIFHLPSPEPDEVSNSGPTHRSRQRRYPQRPTRRPRPVRRSCTGSEIQEDFGLDRRRDIYRHQLLSSHVGSNRISKYQDLNPQRFRGDDVLSSKARKWMRRELQVFGFLDLDRADTEVERRRASDAEFLLEYIMAILRTTDIKGSGGHAEELLKDFLGRDNTRVFLHELQAWLRSPYQHLRDWDGVVQYDESKLQQQDAAESHMNSGKRQASASSSGPASPRRWQSPWYDRYALK